MEVTIEQRAHAALSRAAIEEAPHFHGQPVTIMDVQDVLDALAAKPRNPNKLITKNQFRQELRIMQAQNTLLAKRIVTALEDKEHAEQKLGLLTKMIEAGQVPSSTVDIHVDGTVDAKAIGG